MPHDTTSTKVCSQCGETKPLTEYHRNPQNTDGLQSYCKACKGEYDRAYREANKDHRAEYNRAYYAANRERRLETNRAWRKANPEKVEQQYARMRARHPDRVAARDAINKAVKRGKMPSPRDLPCSVCGEPAQEYHHYLGYAREHWLDVQALCATCHNAQHSRNDEAN